ncbi:MAG TPA: hypothetical protein VFO18_16400 [Methylomirabilota bacterium]|nr:hypothetical protein [Methylomirabilota bacterium]
MLTALLGYVLAGMLASAEADLDCARPGQSRNYIAKLRLADIEWAEDVHREALWMAFGRCPAGSGQTACRAEQQRRFDAEWQQTKAEIDVKYRKMQEDFELRCRASIS